MTVLCQWWLKDEGEILVCLEFEGLGGESIPRKAAVFPTKLRQASLPMRGTLGPPDVMHSKSHQHGQS